MLDPVAFNLSYLGQHSHDGQASIARVRGKHPATVRPVLDA